MINDLRVISIAALTTIFLSGCSEQQATQTQPVSAPDSSIAQPENSVKLQRLYQQAAAVLFKARPLAATGAGVPFDIAGEDVNQRVADYSTTSEAQLRADLMGIVAQLKAFPSATLTPLESENKRVMENVIRYFAGNSQFSNGYVDTWMGLSPFIVNQINGPIIDAPRAMTDAHQVNSLEDAQNYVVRLKKFDKLIASVQEKFIADVELGWVPPKPVLEGAIAYIQRFTAAQPAQHPLITSFAKKLDKLTDMPADEISALRQAAQEAVSNVVYPAYAELAAQASKVIPKAKTQAGVWAQPNGEIYYQDAIRQLGDSELSAEEIHQIGLDEVDRIVNQMHEILVAQGYKQGTVGQRMVALSTEPRFLYEDSEAGRAKLIEDVNGYIDEITAKMDPLFTTKPKYKVEVRAFPKETQDSMPGGQYSPPPLDGSIPGIYWINLRDMQAVASFTLKTLTYHEANPGHHWQISINLEQENMPFLRLIAPYNAYIEGWALYSEQVAYELGMYENDPFGNLGRLQDELFRAVRLVVDTGLHHKRWTREQAIDYMMTITGKPMSASRAEIERYMTWPGQALGYKLGMLEIQSLRAKAQEQMQERFDLAKFHDLILTGGAVPLAVLEQKVSRWAQGN